MKTVINTLLFGFIICSGLQAQFIPDTLIYNSTYNDTFNLRPHEVAVYVFQMPMDGIIEGFNVPVSAIDGDSSQIWVELWSLTYPFNSTNNLYDSSYVDSNGWLGYFPSQTNDTIPSYDWLFQNWNAFGDSGLCTGAELIPNSQDPLYYKLWYGDWAPISIETTGDHWMDLSDTGYPEVQQGDYFGIFLYHYKINGSYEDTTPSVSFSSNNATDINNPYPLLLFSPSCRGISGEGGWHIRSVVLNCEVAVGLPGNGPPVFISINNLPTTLSTENRTVSSQISHDNPSGGGAGVASATIHYQIDSLSALVHDVPMELVSGDSNNGVWEGEIPSQSPGTLVYWYLTATEVSGSPSVSNSFSYTIFEPTPGNDLIYNNQDPLYGDNFYLAWLYFYVEGQPFDIWDASFDTLSAELLNYYSVLIELSGNDGSNYNSDDKIENWWDGDKLYVVAGDEWLRIRYGSDNNTIIPEGDVARTILGIDKYYPDINSTGIGGQEGISRLIPDSAGVTSVLYDFLSDSLLLNYDPQYETGNDNWLDGFEVVDGYTVDMTAYSGVVDSNGNVADNAQIYNVMVHGQAGNGGKSAFMSFDPIALNTTPSYYWIGASSYWNTIHPNCPQNASPLVSVYEALQGIVSVGDEMKEPTAFSLKGNYPNPFNPITNIHYELYKNTQVKITIYDVLGREVRQLVSGELVSGYHKTIWDATNDHGKQVSAGVYLYQIQAGEFVQVKKMVLLK
jgi:hypothetical protein